KFETTKIPKEEVQVQWEPRKMALRGEKSPEKTETFCLPIEEVVQIILCLTEESVANGRVEKVLRYKWKKVLLIGIEETRSLIE
ncbi:unnamed protein product, partial [Dovyalis caffra]